MFAYCEFIYKTKLFVLTKAQFCGGNRSINIITFQNGQGTMDKKRTQQLKEDGMLHPNPDKVRTDLLEKSPFFNANDLMQMKYEMLRSVSVDQRSVADAADIFGLSRVAYYRAQELYQKHGLAGLLPHKRGPKQPHKFTAEVMSFIEEQLPTDGKHPDWNLLSKQIMDRFAIKAHPRSIERAMKQKKMAKD